MTDFQLHPNIARSTHLVADLALCQLRLMDDRRFPWLLLVPRRDGAREIHHLAAADRAVLLEEIVIVSAIAESLFAPEKLNVGALGNITPQLHIHIVARFAADAAWPGPVWGAGTAERYEAAALATLIARLRAALL
ncbi:MAG: HIT domain-containing protein [Thalassobaculales bacterium]